jgi:hypothetical protein
MDLQLPPVALDQPGERGLVAGPGGGYDGGVRDVGCSRHAYRGVPPYSATSARSSGLLSGSRTQCCDTVARYSR